MKFTLILVLSLLVGMPTTMKAALAECATGLPLEGTIWVETCDAKVQECVYAKKALYEYLKNMKDDDEVISVASISSPWRMYDSNMRILRVTELAELIKPNLEKSKKVLLLASWSGVAPHGKEKSLSDELSELLDGFPVTGMDGFLWLKNNGDFYTTKQAFTGSKGGPYKIKPGDDVMMPLTLGWFAYYEDHFAKEKDEDGLISAAVAWDVSMLCPDHALQSFEEIAATFSNPIAAYNAAIMRLDRGEEGDLDTATQLLMQASNSGDEKAKKLLLEISTK